METDTTVIIPLTNRPARLPANPADVTAEHAELAFGGAEADTVLDELMQRFCVSEATKC